MIDEKSIISRLADPATREQAFSALVRTYQQQLYWKIRSIVPVHEDADDVLQNTFVKAWQNIDTFRGESRLQTWLTRIAINESISHLDRKAGQTVSIDSEASPRAMQLTSDAYLDGNEIQQLLRQAIESLPEKQRLVFNLKYFEEMKYEDMNQLLGTSVGALKASYHHAVRKISDFFDTHS